MKTDFGIAEGLGACENFKQDAGLVDGVKRVVVSVNNKSVTVTRPNELNKRENERLAFGLRQALRDLKKMIKANPPNH